jgi:hypothetical protein
VVTKDRSVLVLEILDDVLGDPAYPVSEEMRRMMSGIREFVRRTGKATGRIIRAVAPHVRRCGICGRKALYRYGLVGRCSAHRSVTTEGMERRRADHEQTGRRLEEARKSRDERDLSRNRLRGLGPGGCMVIRARGKGHL